MSEIVELFKNGWSVKEIAREEDISISRVYFVLNKWAKMQDSDIYLGLIDIGCPESEAVAIVSALSRNKIMSLDELASSMENGELVNFWRIGKQRFSMLERVLERRKK